MAVTTPKDAFYWFILTGIWLTLSILPIQLDPGHLYAKILFSISGLLPLPFFLYWNTRDYVWKAFNSNLVDDQELNIFAFLWSHFSLGMCWSVFNLFFWFWHKDWFSNVQSTTSQTDAYGVWAAFIYGSFLALLGSGPAFVVTATAPVTWLLGGLQSAINLGFALCGCGVITAIHRQHLFNKMMPSANNYIPQQAPIPAVTGSGMMRLPPPPLLNKK
jgi:hypothetical protein